VVLAGRVLVPGRGGLPTDHGQVPAGGVEVDLFLCAVRTPCLAMGDPVASVFTTPDGRFSIQVSAALVQGTLPVVAARISPTVVLRTPVLTIPVAAAANRATARLARQVSDTTDIVVDAISEAAVRLLEEFGFEDYSVAGVGAVVQAVKAANADSTFEDLTPETAVSLAQTTAAADPMVQRALQDNRLPTPTVTPGSCVGDCDGSGEVTVDEVIKGVNIALGNASIDTCKQFDADGSGTVTINELIIAVNDVLSGCR